MQKSRLFCAVFGCVMALIFTSSNASIVVIDFDNAAPGGLLTANYLEDGFTMQSTGGHYDINSSGGTGGTAYLGLDVTGVESFSQVRFTGGVFDFVSLENFNFGGESLSVTSSAGGNISLVTDAMHTFSGASWTNLTWIDFSSGVNIAGPGIDTLTFNTVVPIPAAIWLFGSGLLGLIVVAQRAKT